MATFGYIGIDFGTSNSHFAHCVTDGVPPKPETIRLGDSDSQETCVLWKVPRERLAQDSGLIEDYGTMALHTWLEHQIDGHKRGHFGFGFKPDLPNSEQARLDAWAFLHKACEEIRQKGLPRPISPSGYAVVVGVPAEVGEEHRRLTAEIAKKAGFGEVECVEEPLGALAYHLSLKQITSSEARAGVVVVDFGGGTLDVALVNDKGLHKPWGDPTLGGRLFDDLFYQWVADQNQFEVDESETLMVWQKECRRLKEEFSNRWRRKGDELADFKGAIKVGGMDKFLRNASVREFEERARKYRPSVMVRKYFRGLDRVPNGLVLDTPINLLDRISQKLIDGDRVNSLKGKFCKIILTGGSSSWPFMRRLVVEAFGVDADKDVVMSQNPETTIGSGLALYYVLKLHNEGRRVQIKSHKPQAKIDFEKEVMVRLDRYADDVAEALLKVLMPRVEKVYLDWYDNGGSLNQVEIQVKEICKDFEKNEAEGILKRYWVALNADLVRLMRDRLAKFLMQNEMPTSASHYIPESATSIQDLQEGAGSTRDRIAANVGDIAAIVGVIAAIAMLVIAAVKVKVIAAVVLAAAHNPPLAVALGVGAFIAAWVAGQGVKETVENKIKSHEFNKVTRRLLKVVLWPSTFRKKLAEGNEEARKQLGAAIRKSTREIDATTGVQLPDSQASRKPIEQQAIEAFDRIIDVAIQDLGVLEQIPSGTTEKST